MITASELAGFIAAHAIWCVSDADGLVPMVAFTTKGSPAAQSRRRYSPGSGKTTLVWEKIASRVCPA